MTQPIFSTKTDVATSYRLAGRRSDLWVAKTQATQSKRETGQPRKNFQNLLEEAAPVRIAFSN